MLFAEATRAIGAYRVFVLFRGCGVWGEFGAGDEVIQGYIEDYRHGDQGIQAGGTAGLFVHSQGAGGDEKFLG